MNSRSYGRTFVRQRDRTERGTNNDKKQWVAWAKGEWAILHSMPRIHYSVIMLLPDARTAAAQWEKWNEPEWLNSVTCTICIIKLDYANLYSGGFKLKRMVYKFTNHRVCVCADPESPAECVHFTDFIFPVWVSVSCVWVFCRTRTLHWR